jgi:ABC-type tungstate transport system substrate-binding protein
LLDESRLRLVSRFCSFIQTLLCKPILVGCTIYCLVFRSGYLYSWRWFLGTW